MTTATTMVKARIIAKSEVVQENSWPRFENFIVSDTAHTAALKNDLYSTSEYKKEVTPVIKTVETLGFENGATLSQIITRGKSLGLNLLNPKLAISFAKNIDRTGMGAPSNVRIAMEPLKGNYKSEKEGGSLIFSISSNMVGTINASPSKMFEPKTAFLFIV